MLVVVLLLVVLAAGVLVGAVGVGEPEWGWISVLLSVLGAVLLLTDRRRRRAARSAAAPDAETATESATAKTSTGETSTAVTARQPVAEPDPAESEPGPADGSRSTGDTGLLGSRTAESAGSGGAVVLGPVQDHTAGAHDLESAAATKRWERPPAPDPDARVLVVDEYPRYHLPECPWLRDRVTIRLVFREAQELGFTPCARCAPYATLAGRAGEG